MTRMAETGSQHRSKQSTRYALVLAAGLAAACVGSEPGGRSENRVEARTGSTEGRVFGRDTAKALRYHVAETRVESEVPRKVTLHLLVMGETTKQGISATLRSALDSLGRADSTLVAAQAVLYTIRAKPGIVDMVPTAWALWAPPEGWDSAGTGSGRGPYRTFVYHENPYGRAATAAARPSKEGSDG